MSKTEVKPLNRRLRKCKVKELHALLNLAVEQGAEKVDDLFRNVERYYNTLAGGAA